MVRGVWGPQCLDWGIKHTSRASGTKRLMLSSTLSWHLPQLLGIKYLQITWAWIALTNSSSNFCLPHREGSVAITPLLLVKKWGKGVTNAKRLIQNGSQWKLGLVWGKMTQSGMNPSSQRNQSRTRRNVLMGLKEIQQESSCLLPFYKEKKFLWSVFATGKILDSYPTPPPNTHHLF